MFRQDKKNKKTLALRKEGGAFLKTLRNHAGLTQREVAVGLKLNYYTMVAQMESGAARIPPHQYSAYARILGVDPRLFAKKLMQYNDPYTYDILWKDERIPIDQFTSQETNKTSC